MMFHRLMWTNFVYYILDIRLYLSLSVNLTSNFSNFADFRHPQIPNTGTKYYEILLADTKTPHNTTHKIANRYIEFEYLFLTLRKKFRLLLNKGVDRPVPLFVIRAKSGSMFLPADIQASYVLVSQQADYTVPLSFASINDQWSAKTSKLIVYHRV